MAFHNLKTTTKDIDLIVASGDDIGQLQAVLLELGYDIIREPDEEYEALGAQRILENDDGCRISSASYRLTKIERQEAQQEANKRHRLMVIEPPEDNQGTIYLSEVKPGPEKEFIYNLPDAEISDKEKQELTELENGDRIEVKIRETMGGAAVLEEVY
jgi:hypothetical protein